MKYEMNQDIVLLATSRGLKKRRLPTVQLMDKILHDPPRYSSATVIMPRAYVHEITQDFAHQSQ